MLRFRHFFFQLPFLLLPIGLTGQPSPNGSVVEPLPEQRWEGNGSFQLFAFRKPLPSISSGDEKPRPPLSALFRYQPGIRRAVFLQSREDAEWLPRLSEQSTIPRIYSYRELAFFCKLEVQLERRTSIPIKFRLGDVLYVDYLEGKRDSY